MAVPAAFARVMRVLQLYANVPASEVKALAEELDDMPGAGGASATGEALSIPVDYANPAAVTIPAGTTFAFQDDVTKALGGAPAFKFLQEAWDAVARDIGFDVSFNLAAGVHRPKPGVTFDAFTLTGKKTSGGAVRFFGAPPSQWTTVVGPLTVASFTTGADPSLTFAGTPFLGLNLRGLHVVIGTGQVGEIHDHTDSVLRITANPSPNPTGQTARVARPSTILRNSFNDSTPAASSSLISFDVEGIPANFASHEFLDVRVDTFSPSSAGWAWILGGSTGLGLILTRCLNDYAEQQVQFGRNQDGRTFQTGGNGQFVQFTLCGLRCNNAGGGVNDWVFLFGAGSVAFIVDSVAYNPRLGSAAINVRDAGQLFLWRTIIDWISQTDFGCIDLGNGGDLLGFEFGDGVFNEVRNAGVGLWMRRRSTMIEQSSTAGAQTLSFKGCTVGPVRVENGAVIDLRTTNGTHGLRNGTGNAGIGIDIIGTHCAVRLASGTNVTGAGGDTRTAEGTVRSYATVLASGPFTDNALDYLQKVS
ncbi:MAG TPA: hypothetical protein VLI71_05225 [Gammaproteobacteria bacterium]|nr:hypothetical protein [Gammaproteobacteria bacterium]